MRTLRVTGIVFLFVAMSITVFGQDFQQPVLISSAGQSADVKLVNLLASREKLDATVLPGATADDLAKVKTLLIVPGFSSKGLGAAGISQEDEMLRVKTLVKAAKDAKIPVIMVHIGGNARRQGQSDAFNELVAKNAKYMIVVAQGNEDNFFTDISTSNNIPLKLVNSISEAGAPLGELFK